MNVKELLAEERRARLAAERLLELKQKELSGANRKLRHHAQSLANKVTEARAEVAEVRDENARVQRELGEAANQIEQATHKIQEVEGQLWHALETIQDGFATFDADGRLELANPAYLAIFDGLESIGPGASYGHVLEVMVEEGIVDLQGENPREWQIRMIERWDQAPIPPATLRLWNGRFLKIQDRKRNQGGVVSLVIDITELMRMWSAVGELPDGFVMYDNDDRLLMCNQPYRDMYAASAEAMVPGATFEEILRYGLKNGQYADAAGREEDWLEERLHVHRNPGQELEQQLDDGRWLRVYERETSDGGRVGLRVDISDIKKDQKRLEEAMVRAEEANRAKSAFLANMSHEIRTPMNGVVGMADLMMDTDLTEEQQVYLETIRGSSEALLVIINDILDYSKIEADKLILQEDPFDLERAAHEVVTLLGPMARDKGLSLLIDYDMFLPTQFIGDAGRIRQILTNLIGNAVKFTLEGHVTVRVVGFVYADETAAIHITVEDSGIGIPPDKIDHVFGKFNQVEDERNRKFEGTGLGLSITRSLVELMGGEVWVESELGTGSCFGMRLVLPAKAPVTVETVTLPPWLTSVGIADGAEADRALLGKQLELLGLKPEFFDTVPDLAAPDIPPLLFVDLGLCANGAIAMSNDLPHVIVVTENPSAVPPPIAQAAHVVMQKPIARGALFSALEDLNDGPPAALPAEPSQTAPVAPQPPAEDATIVVPETSKPRVLLAEDNKTNQLVFRKMISAFDVDLTIANNGIEAVQAFKDIQPELIFMDISMPEMDGKEATQEIRKLEGAGPNVPIVAVTAHAMTGDKEVILEAGLTDYLTKPLRKAALAEKLTLYMPDLAQELAS